MNEIPILAFVIKIKRVGEEVKIITLQLQLIHEARMKKRIPFLWHIVRTKKAEREAEKALRTIQHAAITPKFNFIHENRLKKSCYDDSRVFPSAVTVGEE